MQILTICGSLSARSYNRAALNTLHDLLFDRVQLLDDSWLARLPPFDPELVDAAPDPVEMFRQQLAASDAVVLATPEYAGGLAGTLKNGLDWLVGSGHLYDKPLGLLSVATTGGPWALQALARTVAYQGAHVVATLGIPAPRTKFTDDGALHDEPTLTKLAAFADALIVGAGLDDVGRRERSAALLSDLDVYPDAKSPFQPVVDPSVAASNGSPLSRAPECYSCGAPMEPGTVVAPGGLYWETGQFFRRDWIIGRPFFGINSSCAAVRCRPCRRLVLLPDADL